MQIPTERAEQTTNTNIAQMRLLGKHTQQRWDDEAGQGRERKTRGEARRVTGSLFTGATRP